MVRWRNVNCWRSWTQKNYARQKSRKRCAREWKEISFVSRKPATETELVFKIKHSDILDSHFIKSKFHFLLFCFLQEWVALLFIIVDNALANLEVSLTWSQQKMWHPCWNVNCLRLYENFVHVVPKVLHCLKFKLNYYVSAKEMSSYQCLCHQMFWKIVQTYRANRFCYQTSTFKTLLPAEIVIWTIINESLLISSCWPHFSDTKFQSNIVQHEILSWNKAIQFKATSEQPSFHKTRR